MFVPTRGAQTESVASPSLVRGRFPVLSHGFRRSFQADFSPNPLSSAHKGHQIPETGLQPDFSGFSATSAALGRLERSKIGRFIRGLQQQSAPRSFRTVFSSDQLTLLLLLRISEAECWSHPCWLPAAALRARGSPLWPPRAHRFDPSAARVPQTGGDSIFPF